jgi:GNAT superfamily N-acetyltransferase
MEAVLFREDSYVCSFGEVGRQKFREENGADGEKYISWLKARIAQDPGFGVHVWQGDRIIGQMEMGAFKPDPSIGYINLYYLIAEFRGTGISKELDEYAIQLLRSKGHKKARLSVSPSNPRAVRYYTRMGWKDVGVRPEAPEVRFMEKEF